MKKRKRPTRRKAPNSSNWTFDKRPHGKERSMSEVLKMTIPGDPEYIIIAETAACQAASLHGMDVERVSDLKLAVGEACRLITCHGFEGWSRSYDITCSIDEAAVTITVKDDLCAHDKKKDEKKRCPDCPNEGDIGFRMIEVITDEVSISRAEAGCRSITLVKKFR